jgi:hypothetical protein
LEIATKSLILQIRMEDAGFWAVDEKGCKLNMY